MKISPYIKVSMMTALAAVGSGCSTVTFVPEQGGSIIGDESQYIFFGGDAEEVYARSQDGYYFVKWEDSKARADHKENPLTLKNVNDTRIVTAKFAPAETFRTDKRTPVGQQSQGVSGHKAGTIPAQPNIRTQVKQSEALNKTSERKVLENVRYLTQSAPARISVQVIGDSKYSAVTRAVEGAIANAGYEVLSDNLYSGRGESPYLSIMLRNSLGEFDKFGNYYIYKGKTELTVKRNIKTASALKTILARETISAKGVRKLGKDDAIESLVNALGSQSADYMKTVCKREMAGITAVTVTLRKEAIRRVFGENMGNEQRIITSVLKRAAKIDGVMSIHQLSTDINTITLEVIYRKKKFPNGVVHDFIDGNINLGSGDAIGQFMTYLFKI